MPHFTQNNILAATYEELVPRFYKSVISLSTVVGRDQKRGYGMRKLNNGGGGHVVLIEFDSLPSHIQDSLGDPRKGVHIMEPFFSVDKEAVSFFQNFKFSDDSSLNDEKIQLYITNASVCNAVLALKEARENEIRSKGKKPKRIWETLCSDTASFNKVLDDKYGVYHDMPDNYRRFKDKIEKYKELSYIGLIKGNHKNTNAKKVFNETIELLQNMFGTQSFKPNYKDIAKQYDGFLNGYVEVINNSTGELYNPKDFKKLSQGTIYNYLSMWESKIGTHAKRSGDRQVLMSKYKPYHSLDMPKYSGSIISIDDRNPPFEYASGQRVWFYNGVDIASQCITTWVYGKTKDGIILDFYRQMVRNYAEWGINIPHELECESSLNSSFKNTFLSEGNMFQCVRIEANNARGKYIERINEKLKYELEKKELGWLPRPFAKSEANQASSTQKKYYPYDNIVEKALTAIETFNNSPHPDQKDKTRFEYFIENQHPNIQPTNYRGIIPYLGFKTATSCSVGMVKLQGHEFLLGDNGKIAFGEKLINLMIIVEGSGIDVYWLDGNDGQILKAYAFNGDQYLCELIQKPTYNRATLEQTPADIENRELMSKYVATIDGFAKRKRNLLETVTVNDKTPLTLNNKFKIPQLHKNTICAEIPEVEIIEENEDEYENELIGFSTGFNSTFKDRY